MIFAIILFLILGTLLVIALTTKKPDTVTTTSTFVNNNEPIYCLMVTGKNICRLDLARKSVDNFREQTYPNKYLLIINHGDTPILTAPHLNIKEVIVDKRDKTLGYLRNLSVSYVPVGGIWTIWDDDDYRSPKYLDVLYSEMIRRGVSTVSFTFRTECNINTGFVWRAYMGSGYVTLLTRKKSNDKGLYMDEDRMEDLQLKKRLLDNGHTFYVLQFNDPLMYIRMVHTNNTSLYVNKGKSALRVTHSDIFKEFEVSESEQKSVLDFFIDYYRKGIACMKHSTN